MRPKVVARLLLGLIACTRGEPPGSDIAPERLAIAPLHARPSDAPSSPDAGSTESEPSTQVERNDRPLTTGPLFTARVAALFQAIVADDFQRAMPFFFPLTAYAQVKAIAQPERDWRRRLVAAYARDIHALHVRLGERAPRARLVGFDVPSDRARWVRPGEEGNRLGYYRVYGTTMRLVIEGRPRTFQVKSLISWRGDWYVVHLSGFR